MRIERMAPLHCLLATCLMAAGALPHRVQAQTTPVVTLRTLADVQQWQDELNLRDRVQALQQRRPGATPVSAAPPPLPPRLSDSALTSASPAPVRQLSVRGEATDLKPEPRLGAQGNAKTDAMGARKTRQRKPLLHMLSVYGPEGRLTAEAQVRGTDIREIRTQDRVGPWTVTHIAPSGVLLHTERTASEVSQRKNSVPGDSSVFLSVGDTLQEEHAP